MKRKVSDQPQPLMRVRIDRWLWAARFFKTRSQAKIAVAGGKVHVNGARAKPSRDVRIDDHLRITRATEELDITVLAMTDERGPATIAQKLYSEHSESIDRRATLKAQRRMERAGLRMPRSKPGKRDRRHRMRLKARIESD